MVSRTDSKIQKRGRLGCVIDIEDSRGKHLLLHLINVEIQYASLYQCRIHDTVFPCLASQLNIFYTGNINRRFITMCAPPLFGTVSHRLHNLTSQEGA